VKTKITMVMVTAMAIAKYMRTTRRRRRRRRMRRRRK
jgi:hypothetical protein